MKTVLLTICCLLVFIWGVKAEKAVGKHGNWVKCLIVTAVGDTVYAVVKDKKDYSTEGSLSPNNELSIRHTDGTIAKLDISTLRELIFFEKSAGFNHYLSLNINQACPGQFNLYRVITDGACKLLYREVPATSGKMVQTANGFGNDYSVPAKSAYDEYNIYYNNKLTIVHVDDDLNLNSISKSDCLEIFKTCPMLLKRLNDRKAKNLKLNELINVFNGCRAK